MAKIRIFVRDMREASYGGVLLVYNGFLPSLSLQCHEMYGNVMTGLCFSFFYFILMNNNRLNYKIGP